MTPVRLITRSISPLHLLPTFFDKFVAYHLLLAAFLLLSFPDTTILGPASYLKLYLSNVKNVVLVTVPQL